MTLPEGSPATLSCQLLAGSPIPSLGWRKCDGSHFSTGEEKITEDVIEIESVNRDDSGCYVCEADNGFAEEPVTSEVQLVVECKYLHRNVYSIKTIFFQTPQASKSRRRMTLLR